MQSEKKKSPVKAQQIWGQWIWAMSLILVLFASGRLAADEPTSVSSEAASPPGTIEFVGKNLIANAQGTFHRWRVVESAIDFKNASDTAALESGYVVVEVDLSSIDTQNESRDEHLRTADFFDVEQYPIATARGYGLKAIGQSEAGLPRYSISFDLDLHGVRKTVEGEVELTSREPLVVEGDLELNRVDFKIGSPASRWNPMSIKEIIPVHFRVEL